MQILREVTLIPKGQTFAKNKRFGGEQGFGNKRGAGRGRSGTNRQERDKPDSGSKGRGRGRPKPEETRFKLCKWFNVGKCTYEDCVFSHMCALCGDKEHGENDHPN